MKTISSQQARLLDQRALQTYGIPALLLMDHAGRAIAEEVRGLRKPKANVAVICGGGNNGGDGLSAARWLRTWGYSVQVFWLRSPSEYKGSVALHFAMAKRLGVSFQSFSALKPAQRLSMLKQSAVIVDAIMGIGHDGPLRIQTFDAIATINAAGRPVVSADLPTGLDADKGLAHDLAVKAKVTVTMGLAKRGLLQPSARPYVGRLVVADIGLPR